MVQNETQSPSEIFFAENFRHERERRHLTKSYLATLWGMTSTALGMWETKKAQPNIALFVKICDYFGKSPTEMLLRRLDADPSNAPPTEPPSERSELQELRQQLQESRKELRELKQQLQTLQEQFAAFTSREKN